jgi:hypothetical protein
MVALLPAARVTRSRVLALLALGILWSGSLTLLRVAATLPLAACDPSIERRLRRFLANRAVTVETLWVPLLPHLLAGLGQRDLLLVFDPTPYRGDATILCLGVVVRHRVLPLAWQVLPQQEPWPERLAAILPRLLAPVAAALPAGATVTLLADRGLVGPTVIDAAVAVGWHVVLRLRAGAKEATRVRRADGTVQRLPELVAGPGQRLAAPVAIFQDVGWRQGWLTIHWARGEDEPWVLFSDRAGGGERVREYRRRVCAEATYEDAKGRGFALERSKIVAHDRLERLLLALHLALWWAYGLGLQVVRNGQRHRFDRRGRRDLSLIRLGRTACAAALDAGHRIALPFQPTPLGWRFPWLP